MTKAADSNASADPTPKPKRPKGGAPFGNCNAGKHLAYAKKQAKKLQDRHRRGAQRMVREMLRDLGLENDPTAKLVGLQIERLEEVARRVYAYMEQRGFADRAGNPKPMLKLFVETTDRVLGEARRLLQMLGSKPQEQTLTALIAAACERDEAERASGAYSPPVATRHTPTPTQLADALGDEPIADFGCEEHEQSELLAKLSEVRDDGAMPRRRKRGGTL